MRRAFYVTMILSIIVLPLWLLFGRTLFGAPLGPALLVQALLVPLAGILIAAVVGVTLARKEVRGPRTATWHDVRVLGPWFLGFLIEGMLIVDGTGDATASALTALVGDGALTASASIAAVLGIVLAIAGVMLLVIQTRLLMQETRARVSSYLDGVGVQSQGPIVGEAIFERIDTDERRGGPQTGETITLEPGDDRR